MHLLVWRVISRGHNLNFYHMFYTNISQIFIWPMKKHETFLNQVNNHNFSFFNTQNSEISTSSSYTGDHLNWLPASACPTCNEPFFLRKTSVSVFDFSSCTDKLLGVVHIYVYAYQIDQVGRDFYSIRQDSTHSLQEIVTAEKDLHLNSQGASWRGSFSEGNC